MSETADTIRVLHVDDESDFADMVSTFLEREDDRLDVRTATTPTDGLDILVDHEIDCIVSDYDMPRMTGIELLETVREEHPDLPFILYTGKGSEEIASDAISAGVTDYIQKDPTSSQYTVLAHRISNAVEQYRSRQAVQATERKLSQLAEKTDEILFMFNSDWTELLFINSAYEDVWGGSIAELEDDPRSFLGNIHPDDEQLAERTLERILDGNPTEVEHRILTDEGDVRWIYSEAKPVFDEDGSVSRIVGFVRDITDRKEHERKLREEQQFVQSIFQSLPDPLYAFDTEGYSIRWNERFEAVSGYSGDEIGAMHVTEFVPEEEADTITATFEPILDEQRTVTVESAIETKDGDRIPFELTGGPLEDADGTLRGMTGIGRDITQRKERERDLERTRDFFTEAERLGDLGAWEFDASGDLRWTDGTKRIHDVDDDFEPTMEDAIEFFHPEDRERIEQAVETALEAGESYDLEARLITADGTQRWVRTRGKVLSGEEPRTVRGYVQDITEQKEREQELQNARTQLENAVEAGTVGTWEWHIPDDRLVAGKEFATRFGVDPDIAQEGVELDRFISSIHEDDRGQVEREIEAAIEACGEYETEYRVWDAENNLNWVLARGHVECDQGGTPVRFPGVLVDITERKQVERELERQNKRLNEFASVISHDLRNPLNVAEGKLQLAHEECNSDHLEAVRHAHDRIRRLIDDLLTLARDGEAVSDLELIDLASVAEQCWRTVETKDSSLVTEVDRRIRADRSRLQQLLENLVRNAVDHGGEEVVVTVGEVDGGFYVEDDGPGIPPGERDDVFDPGYSTADEGTGFGLSIVKQVVEAHDWEIHITDGSDGGVRFEITGVESSG